VSAILREIGLSGAVDIVVIALLLYAVSVWFRGSRAIIALQGMALLGALYLAALLFGLQLTTVVFEGFFAVLLIAVIVIFRDELRRFFERIADWSPARHLGRKKVEATSVSRVAEAIARTLVDLGGARIGALIVVSGQDALDGLIQGGVPLGGTVSVPLLESLFDPSSPGHDGAVIVDGEHVRRFACHLPLSTNFEQLGDRGTRHAAALGLSERSDALCLVVSEERGTIAIARRGVLRELLQPAEVIAALRQFTDKPVVRSTWPRLLWHDVRGKAVALVIAFVLWAVVIFGGKSTVRSLTVPVAYRAVGSGLQVQRTEPRDVTVTVTGPRRSFYFLKRGDLAAAISLAGFEAGEHRLVLLPSHVVVPPRLTLRDVQPQSIRVLIAATVRKRK
jgi:diadenylate cyclase